MLSPSTRKLDLGDKRAIYAREGVSNLWLVDPNVQSLGAFQLRGTQWVVIDTLFDDAIVSLPPFEAISFNLGDLWSPHAVHRDAPTEEQPGKPTAGPELEQVGTLKQISVTQISLFLLLRIQGFRNRIPTGE